MKGSKTGSLAKGESPADKGTKGFSEEERAAIKERAREVTAEERPTQRTRYADGEKDALAKIAEMPEADRAMAERIHAIVKTNAPGLSPKTWYGMPAYARGGDVVCFFQSSHKFKTRYSTLGFSDKANLDEGRFWPVAYALKELTAPEEARIAALVKKAAG